MESIGIWNDILRIMTIISTVVNACFMAFTSQYLTKSITGDQLTTFMLVVLVEHLVFVLKTLLSKVIKDVPDWVTNRVLYSKFLEDKARI